MKYIFENINEIPKLKELDLQYNEISNIGGEILLENIDKCKELKVLKTYYNNKISNYEDFKKRIREKHPNKSLEIDVPIKLRKISD